MCVCFNSGIIRCLVGYLLSSAPTFPRRPKSPSSLYFTLSLWPSLPLLYRPQPSTTFRCLAVLIHHPTSSCFAYTCCVRAFFSFICHLQECFEYGFDEGCRIHSDSIVIYALFNEQHTADIFASRKRVTALKLYFVQPIYM